MSEKTTLVVGASTNERRYSNMAVRLLTEYNHKIYAFGLKEDFIGDIKIHTEWPEKGSIDTVTMYIGVNRQKDIYDNLTTLSPRRVIFNPGTENAELAQILKNNDIEVVMKCSLIMLQGGIY